MKPFDQKKQTDEILQIIDKGDKIIEYFRQSDPICKKILNIREINPSSTHEIIMGKQLGKGEYGTVYKVDSDVDSSKKQKPWTNRLVAKELTLEMVLLEPSDPRAIKFYGEEFKVPIGMPKDLLRSCTLDEYTRADNKAVIKTNDKDIFCAESLTEFLIALWVGNLYATNLCVNFIETFYFAVCANHDRTKARYYTFMEQIDRDFQYIMKHPYPEEIYNNIYIQILFAVAAYQKYGKIVHGDLHDGNVFLFKVNLGYNKDTAFNGQNLFDADYMEYQLGDTSYYVPTYKIDTMGSQFIVKIGDWGRAVKYSEPMIGSRNTMLDVYPIPNWYNRAFDILTITRTIQTMKYSSQMIQEIASWMEGTTNDKTKILEAMDNTKYNNYRHVVRVDLLEKHYSHVNPESVLSLPVIMQQYTKKPSAGLKTVLCGKI